MKAANSNPMGSASTSHKPDAGVLRQMKAKMSANMNQGNQIVNKPTLNRPTAKAAPNTNVMAPGKPPKPAKAKLNRKARTS